MSDDTQDSNNASQIQATMPPSAEAEHAEKYIDWLTQLIDQDKVEVYHSDLSKFNMDSMQNHYRLNLNDYEVEVSHSKQTNTGEDMYVMIFNNLRNMASNACERTILSFIHLSSSQFKKFQYAADNQINRRVKEEQEKQFKEVMVPVDNLLSQMTQSSAPAAAAEPAPQPEIVTQDSNATISDAPTTPQESVVVPTKETSDDFDFQDFSNQAAPLESEPQASAPTEPAQKNEAAPESPTLSTLAQSAPKQNLTPNLVKPPLPEGFNPMENMYADDTPTPEATPATTPVTI